VLKERTTYGIPPQRSMHSCQRAGSSFSSLAEALEAAGRAVVQTKNPSGWWTRRTFRRDVSHGVPREDLACDFATTARVHPSAAKAPPQITSCDRGPTTDSCARISGGARLRAQPAVRRRSAGSWRLASQNSNPTISPVLGSSSRRLAPPPHRHNARNERIIAIAVLVGNHEPTSRDPVRDKSLTKVISPDASNGFARPLKMDNSDGAGPIKTRRIGLRALWGVFPVVVRVRSSAWSSPSAALSDGTSMS
jgi:hypothetical protein